MTRPSVTEAGLYHSFLLKLAQFLVDKRTRAQCSLRYFSRTWVLVRIPDILRVWLSLPLKDVSVIVMTT